jgi:hypothetical protein
MRYVSSVDPSSTTIISVCGAELKEASSTRRDAWSRDASLYAGTITDKSGVIGQPSVYALE